MTAETPAPGQEPKLVLLLHGIALAALECIRQEYEPGTMAHDTALRAIQDTNTARAAGAATPATELAAELDGLRKALHAISLGITEPPPKTVAQNALNGRYFDPETDAGVWEAEAYGPFGYLFHGPARQREDCTQEEDGECDLTEAGG